MTTLSIIGIFVGLAVLIYCSMKGFSVFISAILASIIIALTGAVSLQQAILTDFMSGFVGFISGNFMVFAAGALMGKAYEVTHGAKSIAKLFVGLFGKKYAPYALLVAVTLMTGGGITGFVLIFKIDGNPLMPTAFGIFIGAALAYLLMFKYKTDDKTLAAHVGAGFQGALNSIGNTAAMAAVGTVAKTTAGFAVMLEALTGMGGNPLISAAICGGIICWVTGGATGGLSMLAYKHGYFTMRDISKSGIVCTVLQLL